MTKNTKKSLFSKINLFFTKTLHKIEKKFLLVKNKKEKVSIDKVESDIQKLTITDEKKEEYTNFSIDTKSAVRFWFF